MLNIDDIPSAIAIGHKMGHAHVLPEAMDVGSQIL
jgi:hypothetical protein